MQYPYELANQLPQLWRQALNNALAAILSRNSSPTTAPSSPVQGMVYVKTVSATVHEVYEYDSGAWVLRYVINPTTHEYRSIDGNRRQWGGLAGGTADALTITTTPAISAYEDGQRFVLYTGAAANTGAMTLNVDSAGAKAIKINGADPAAGDVPANSLLVVQYRSNIFHVVGGALPRATTARYGHVLLDNEAGFLAATAGKVPTSDVVKKHARERLQANRTYYVRTDGNDSNTGLVDSAGGAFLTIQKAADVISSLDLAGHVVTVKLGAGAHTAGLVAAGAFHGGAGPDSVVFQGNAASPGSVTLTVTGADCFSAEAGAALTVEGMELATVTDGNCLRAGRGGHIVYKNCEFGACAAAHVSAEGGLIEAAPGFSYSLTGGARQHWNAEAKGMIAADDVGAISLIGTIAIGTAFARADGGVISCTGNTFAGTATGLGRKYNASKRGVIDTGTGDVNHLPGAQPGTTSTEGVYA